MNAVRHSCLVSNYCGLFLQATRLSKICTLEGTSIDRTAWCGTARLARSHDWPQQGRPGPEAWRLWRRTLIEAFCPHQPDTRVLISAPGVLDYPLGPWRPASRPLQLARYLAFLEPTTNLNHTFRSQMPAPQLMKSPTHLIAK
jgi:hypothetical protein